MRTLVAIALSTAALITANGDSCAQPANSNSSTNQMAKRLERKITTNVELNYLLFLPNGYSKQGSKEWPMILFLHGAGERGSNIWKVAIHGPPKDVGANPDFPFIVVSPQCPEGKIWSNDSLLALLDEVTAQEKVDRSRIYLTGLSMGGYGAWSLGLTHPEKFAAMAPICGGGNLISILLSDRDKAQALKTIGIWAFHGGKDPVVPLQESQRMVDAVRRAGISDVKLTVYPEAGHDSWTEAYKDPELYKWFLAHQREVK
jgi:predicted peptidase